MSVTKSHRQNLALNLWRNSIVTVLNSQRLGYFVKYVALVPLLLLGLATQADTPVFEIGKFSLDPREQIPKVQPIADHLAKMMQSFGYQSGAARVYPSFESAQTALAQGSLDSLTTSPYEAVQMMRKGLATPVAVKWKDGISEYSSLIIVNADSNISRLQDLAGKTIAFEDPGSTSGYFIPYMALRQAGLNMTRTGTKPEAINNLRYSFTEAAQNSLALLSQGQVDAIAVSDIDWTGTDQLTSQQKQGFRVIWISDPYPTAIELINAATPAEQRAFLENLLIRLHLSETGQTVLKKYHNTSRFSRLSDRNRAQLQSFINFLETEQLPDEY